MSVLTVGDLLDIPHLHLTAFAGEAGLHREVTWVHISDLPNPWEWLGDGELLLTNGLSLPADGAGQVAFLDTLCAVGVSGVAVGTDMPGPNLREEFRRHAEQLGVAILLVPYSVPFSAIVRAAADANSREEGQRLTRIARVYELMRAAVAGEQSRRTVLDRLGAELHCRFWLVDPELGTPLVPGAEQTSLRTELSAAYAAHHGMFPGALHLSGSSQRGVAVRIPVDQPAALVAVPTGERIPDLDLLHHVATVGALEVAELRAERERKRRQGAELLARLMEARLDSRNARRQLRSFGLAVDDAVLTAVRREDIGEAGDSLHHQLSRRGIEHAILVKEPHLFTLLPSTPRPLQQVLSVLSDAGGVVGVSARLTTPERMPEAAREATWSVGVGKATGETSVFFTAESTLLVPRTLDEASLVVSRVLGPLITYDEDHHAQLLRTLQAVLNADRSWQVAARELHVHKQTLAYRIRQIEKLTDRSLRSTKDIGELWFGLRAYELTQGRSTDEERP